VLHAPTFHLPWFDDPSNDEEYKSWSSWRCIFFSLLLFAVFVQWYTINFNHIRGGSRSLPDGPHGTLTGYDAVVRR
jgi:hypothetical protein